MTNTLRWLAVIPACIVAWYVALFVGLSLHGAVEGLCPPDQIVSGFCEASWFPTAERSVICFGAALSAVFVILTATIVAPNKKHVVPWFSLGSGLLVAAWMAIRTGAYFEFVAAALAGAVAAYAVSLIVRRPRGKHHVV